MQPYAAPLPPYAVHAPVAYAPPPAPVPVAMPRIAYRDVQTAPISRMPEATGPSTSWGLVVAGGLLVMAAVLVWIAFAVQVRTYLGLDAHWAANVALVPEAREAGLHAAKLAALGRIVGFGPLGLLSTAIGLVAVLRGMNPRA